MKNEYDIKLKRAYWQGVYYSLNPEKKERSVKEEEDWLTASVWLTALDWVLGLAHDSISMLREAEDDRDWS